MKTQNMQIIFKIVQKIFVTGNIAVIEFQQMFNISDFTDI